MLSQLISSTSYTPTETTNQTLINQQQILLKQKSAPSTLESSNRQQLANERLNFTQFLPLKIMQKNQPLQKKTNSYKGNCENKENNVNQSIQQKSCSAQISQQQLSNNVLSLFQKIKHQRSKPKYVPKGIHQAGSPTVRKRLMEQRIEYTFEPIDRQTLLVSSGQTLIPPDQLLQLNQVRQMSRNFEHYINSQDDDDLHNLVIKKDSNQNSSGAVMTRTTAQQIGGGLDEAGLFPFKKQRESRNQIKANLNQDNVFCNIEEDNKSPLELIRQQEEIAKSKLGSKQTYCRQCETLHLIGRHTAAHMQMQITKESKKAMGVLENEKRNKKKSPAPQDYSFELEDFLLQSGSSGKKRNLHGMERFQFTQKAQVQEGADQIAVNDLKRKKIKISERADKKEQKEKEKEKKENGEQEDEGTQSGSASKYERLLRDKLLKKSKMEPKQHNYMKIDSQNDTTMEDTQQQQIEQQNKKKNKSNKNALSQSLQRQQEAELAQLKSIKREQESIRASLVQKKRLHVKKRQDMKEREKLSLQLLKQLKDASKENSRLIEEPAYQEGQSSEHNNANNKHHTTLDFYLSSDSEMEMIYKSLERDATTKGEMSHIISGLKDTKDLNYKSIISDPPQMTFNWDSIFDATSLGGYENANSQGKGNSSGVKNQNLMIDSNAYDDAFLKEIDIECKNLESQKAQN